MADLIDRDAVIKQIAETQDKVSSGIEDVTFYRAIKIIRSTPAVNRWIPCSERLPETDVDVLAYYPFWYDNMFQNSGVVVAKLCHDRMTWDICGEFNPALSSITHWMPLPNPPEKE